MWYEIRESGMKTYGMRETCGMYENMWNERKWYENMWNESGVETCGMRMWYESRCLCLAAIGHSGKKRKRERNQDEDTEQPSAKKAKTCALCPLLNHLFDYVLISSLPQRCRKC